MIRDNLSGGALHPLHKHDNRTFFKFLKVSVVHTFAKTYPFTRSVDPYDRNDNHIYIFYLQAAFRRFVNLIAVPSQRQTIVYHFETFFHYKRNKYFVFFAHLLHQISQVHFDRHRHIKEDRTRFVYIDNRLDTTGCFFIQHRDKRALSAAQLRHTEPSKSFFIQNISPGSL